jgi:large subunit ribosomal protein L18
MATKTKREMRIARHKRLRNNLRGTPERPRLAVFRSLNHISVQLIDDVNGVTICSASSQEKGIADGGNVRGAASVGELVAKRAKEKGVKAVVFDRGGYRYSGRVAQLADSARKSGLEF